MAEFVYISCAIMSFACAIKLLGAYRKKRSHLLFWSSLCFVGLALNGLFLFIDMVLFPELDMGGAFWRGLIAAISGSILLFGLIWEIS